MYSESQFSFPPLQSYKNKRTSKFSSKKVNVSTYTDHKVQLQALTKQTMTKLVFYFKANYVNECINTPYQRIQINSCKLIILIPPLPSQKFQSPPPPLRLNPIFPNKHAYRYYLWLFNRLINHYYEYATWMICLYNSVIIGVSE